MEHNVPTAIDAHDFLQYVYCDVVYHRFHHFYKIGRPHRIISGILVGRAELLMAYIPRLEGCLMRNGGHRERPTTNFGRFRKTAKPFVGGDVALACRTCWTSESGRTPPAR